MRLQLDYSQTYTADDLRRAIAAARETAFKCSLPFCVTCATGSDRGQALEAWQRVAELAAWIELHSPDDDESRAAAREARTIAERERQRLAGLPMADDTQIADDLRRRVIAATDGHMWRALTPAIRSAIRGRYVPASPDLDDSPIDRLEAEMLDLKPHSITCKSRRQARQFELNVG